MDMSDLAKLKDMMSQAQDMQEQMDQKLAATTVEATSGGGVVTVHMNGKKEVLKLKIDPAVMGSSAADLELLEDLIIAAVNQAARRADDAAKSTTQSMTQSMMGGLMGDLDLPELN